MQSIGMFFRLAQGDAVTAIDLVGVIPTRSMATRRNQSTGKRRSSRPTNTLVGTPGHAFRGEGAFMRASDWRRPLGIKVGGSFPQDTLERNPCNCRTDALMFLDRAVSAKEVQLQYDTMAG